MSRFYDDLQNKPPISPFTGQVEQPPKLTNGEIILVDNVADYYFSFVNQLDQAETEKKNLRIPWDYDKHFPFCAPPFPEMWFEFRVPSNVMIRRAGVLVVGREVNEEDFENATEESPLYHMRRLGFDRESVRWILEMVPFAERRNGAHMGPYGIYTLGIQDSGALAKRLDHHGYLIQSPQRERSARVQPILINPVLMALSFMHVKNSTLVPRKPEFPKNKAKRKRQRDIAPSRYYVLRIDPIDRAYGGARRHQQEHAEASLHIVRGNFADYTEGKGLFGRLHGRYWRGAHIRGNPDRGVVEKDYEVRSPNELLDETLDGRDENA